MNRQSNLLRDAPVRPPMSERPKQPTSYLDLYGLSRPPFGEFDVHESGRYILFNSHRPAFERLLDHMVNAGGLAVLAGDEGSGKTEMLAAAARVAADSGLHVLQPIRPVMGRLDRADIIAAILDAPDVSQPDEINNQAALTALLSLPRAILLLDDVELLTQASLNFIDLVLERNAETIALVTTTSLDYLATLPQSHPVRLARTQIQVPRLSAAEVRQYIERALWMSGGTIQRLVAPDALRLIIAQSKGLPASINRIMEAAFTAAFVRDDPLITAATVVAAVAPPARRVREDAPRPLVNLAHWSAYALLLSGVVAFLYQGLVVPDRQPDPAETMETVTKSAETSRNTDLATVRNDFQKAALAGNAQAALGLAKSYDPAYQQNGADPVRASYWYRAAAGLGAPEANDLMKKLVLPTVKPKTP